MSAGNGKAHLNGFRPQAPSWAVDAGIPEPEPDETFRAYVKRLGLNPEPMLAGLDKRSMVCANIRLAQKLADENPRVWNAHLEDWVANIRKATL